MKKQQLLEQQEKIMKMFSYTAGMTISENDEQYKEKTTQINEIAPLAAVGWGLTAVWAGYEIWKWATNAFGAKDIVKKLMGALDKNTWPKIAKSMKQTSIKLGEDISDRLQIIDQCIVKIFLSYLPHVFLFQIVFSHLEKLCLTS